MLNDYRFFIVLVSILQKTIIVTEIALGDDDRLARCCA